jgi:hypothetical protein
VVKSAHTHKGTSWLLFGLLFTSERINYSGAVLENCGFKHLHIIMVNQMLKYMYVFNVFMVFEMMDLLVLGIVTSIISILIGIICGMVSHVIRNKDLGMLIAKVDHIEMTRLSEKGANVRNEKRERTNMAMAEAAALYQSGKKPEEIMKELLPKYPDIALELVKKGGISL